MLQRYNFFGTCKKKMKFFQKNSIFSTIFAPKSTIVYMKNFKR